MSRPALLLTLALLLVPLAAGAEDWFSLRPDTAAAWTATATGPDRVAIERVGHAPDGKRIVVLYVRASSAYRTAMSRILDIFAQKRLAPSIEAILVGDDVKAGLAALRHAEESGAGLILAMGSEAADLVVGHHSRGRVPALTVCAKDPVMLGHVRDYQGGSGTNVAFTSLNLPIDTLLAYMTRLHPRLKAVGILVDTDNVSAMQTQAVPLTTALRHHGIASALIGIETGSRHDVRSQLQTRVPRALALLRAADPELTDSALLITGSTAVFNEIDSINAAAGTLPVLSMVPDVVTAGSSSALASIGVSFDSNAHLAALYAIDILYEGARPQTMKVGVVSPPDIAINFLKARQIGLRIPFPLFEMASRIYDGSGKVVRRDGQDLRAVEP